MARKGRESLTEAPPPAASSSEENDSDSGSGEFESSSEDESEHQTQQPQQPPKKPEVSESDSDTGSDTDSESDPKPTPSEQPKSKPTPLPASHVTALTAVSNKRKNTKADTSDKGVTPKKAKKEEGEPSGSTPVPEEGGSKKLFQRVWSDDDEIVILKGLIEFKAKKGKDPMSNVDGFIDFIKNSLHVADVKKEQIVSKVRRLKGRYQNAKKRNLTNPHELQAFMLSKSIWGGPDGDVGVDEKDNGVSLKSPSKSKTKASNVKSKDVKTVTVNGGVLIDGGKKVEDADGKIKGDEKIKNDERNAVSMTMSVSHGIQLEELNKFGIVNEKFMKEGLALLGDDERDELEEEWRNFNIAQMEVLVKQLELYQKTVKSLLNAVKSAKP